MARLLAVTVALGCISLLDLLPGALSAGLGRVLRLARPREPSARTLPSSPHPWHSAPRPVAWKPPHASQPQGRGSRTPAAGQPLPDRGPRPPLPRRRHLGPRRAHAQLLRVGCVLGTCQVQNLSHRLWQLVRPADRRDSAPMDPSSPHSYG